MALRRSRRGARPPLTDITLQGTQIFLEPEITMQPGRMTLPLTPVTPERIPHFSPSFPSAAWVPLTPPSLGRCTRSRSKSASPKNSSLSVSDDSLCSPSTSFNFNNSGHGQRASPRKRLALNASSSKTFVFDKSIQISPKKYKLDLNVRKPVSCTKALEGLSHAQLVALVGNLVSEDQQLEQKLQQLLPEPDLKPIEKELKYLRLSILRSLPSRSRLSSRTDAVAFSRAHIHLLSFWKYLMTTGNSISKSTHYNAIVDFVFMAWYHVRQIPIWDKPCHNDIRVKCFKFLAQQLTEALQKESFTMEEVEQMLDQTAIFLADSEEIRCCVNILESKLSQLSQSPSKHGEVSK